MKQSIKNFVGAVESYTRPFRRSDAKPMFMDNDVGKVGIKVGTVVERMEVVNTDAELGYAKSSLQSNAYIFNNWLKVSRGCWRDTNPSKAEVGLSDVAIPTDLSGFAFNTATGNIENPVDTRSMVGFISPDSFDEYVLDVKLKSNSEWQNDPMGLLIGYVRDSAGNTHTLTVFRSLWNNYSGLNSALQVAVDYNTDRGVVILNHNEGLLWVNGTPATGPAPTPENSGGVAPHAVKPWIQAPNGIDLKITRNGDNFKIETSNYDVPGFVPEATVNFTLNDHPALAQFKGPSPYGYVAISQDMAIWEARQRPGNAASVVDGRTLLRHSFVNGVWVTTPATDLEIGRYYYSDYSGKLWYLDKYRNMRQIVK